MAPIPRSAIWLTASGYLPFAIATLIICARLMPGVWAGPWTELVREWALTAALGYGAVILSFLGGGNLAFGNRGRRALKPLVNAFGHTVADRLAGGRGRW